MVALHDGIRRAKTHRDWRESPDTAGMIRAHHDAASGHPQRASRGSGESTIGFGPRVSRPIPAASATGEQKSEPHSPAGPGLLRLEESGGCFREGEHH